MVAVGAPLLRFSQAAIRVGSADHAMWQVARRPSVMPTDGRQPSSAPAREQSRQLRSSSPRRDGRCSGMTAVPATAWHAASRSTTFVSVSVPTLKAGCEPRYSSAARLAATTSPT